MKISVKNILFYVFVFFITSYIILEVFVPTKTVDILGFKSYVIVSTSMEPDIMVNDLIVIRKTKEEKLDIRDTITFSVFIPELGRENAVTHYIGDIVEINGETIYKTQGANKEFYDFDEWENENNEPIEITYDDIEGRVALVIPKFGHVVNLIKDPISLGLLIINGFIIYLLIKVFKSKEKVVETEDGIEDGK
jgi:signal peptidase